jgi:hypothetical protein
MKAIWKFTLQQHIRLPIPKGAKLLDVQTQNEHPQAWFLVDPEQPEEDRIFRVYPTGVGFDDSGLTYTGTFQIKGGALVFHVFEEARAA